MKLHITRPIAMVDAMVWWNFVIYRISSFPIERIVNDYLATELVNY